MEGFALIFLPEETCNQMVTAISIHFQEHIWWWLKNWWSDGYSISQSNTRLSGYQLGITDQTMLWL